MQTDKLSTFIQSTLTELKAFQITQLDVTKLTTMTDYMVICSARSTRHAKSVAEHLAQQLKNQEINPVKVSGYETSEWILVDCGDVVTHIMLPDVRDFYNLEKLWGIQQKQVQTNE